jgi:hypothetical protein
MIDDRRVEVEAECLSCDGSDLQRASTTLPHRKGFPAIFQSIPPAHEAWSCPQALILFQDIYPASPRGIGGFNQHMKFGQVRDYSRAQNQQMHTFSTFHLIATGVLLTGHGVTQANALGWGNPGGIENIVTSTGNEITTVREERDLAILADLGEFEFVALRPQPYANLR